MIIFFLHRDCKQGSLPPIESCTLPISRFFEESFSQCVLLTPGKSARNFVNNWKCQVVHFIWKRSFCVPVWTCIVWSVLLMTYSHATVVGSCQPWLAHFFSCIIYAPQNDTNLVLVSVLLWSRCSKYSVARIGRGVGASFQRVSRSHRCSPLSSFVSFFFLGSLSLSLCSVRASKLETCLSTTSLRESDS